jgi:26S proteasome regulatory subunit N11
LCELAKSYQKLVEDEKRLTREQLAIANVGKLDPKKHLEDDVQKLMSSNIKQTLGAMLDSIAF